MSREDDRDRVDTSQAALAVFVVLAILIFLDYCIADIVHWLRHL